jgi:hypothetical protein
MLLGAALLGSLPILAPFRMQNSTLHIPSAPLHRLKVSRTSFTTFFPTVPQIGNFHGAELILIVLISAPDCLGAVAVFGVVLPDAFAVGT